MRLFKPISRHSALLPSLECTCTCTFPRIKYIRSFATQLQGTNASNTESSLFHYTSGRWLWHETTELKKRYQPFNVEKLKEVSAAAAGAESCAHIAKIAEGAYNKVFLLTMNNNTQSIAKVPNPFAAQKFAISSEVATLDFLRNELDIPVPKVYAWSDSNHPIGTPYVIMDRAPGQELFRNWYNMHPGHKVDIVTELLRIQTKIASVDFKHFGSIYYKDSIQNRATFDIPGYDRFCIGPSVEYKFWEDERAEMHEFQGPCMCNV